MNNILKLLCLAIVPSLSFASDQTASSPDLSGYQLTQKVLEAYFKAAPADLKSAFQHSRWTKPDNTRITVYEPQPEDTTIEFKVEPNIDADNFAPGTRNSIIAFALTQALNKKINQNESLLSRLFRSSYNTEQHWLDDGTACKYTKREDRWHDYRIDCHGSIPRELFDAMKKNAEKFEAMKQQQQDQASCAPSVAVSTPESKPLPTNPAPAPAVNKTENDDFMKKIREQGLKKTTPDQAAVSEELIKQLVRSGQYTATQEGTTTTLSFAFSKFSDKMRGYAEDAVKNDIRKYGNNKIPPHVLSRCGNDMECLFTWVFWWNHPNAFGSSGQYWLKNGCVMTAGASSEGPAGYVSMPTELFESMKKEANKAS